MSNASIYEDNKYSISMKGYTMKDWKRNFINILDCMICLINTQHFNIQQSSLTNKDMIDDAKAIFQMFFIRCLTIKDLLYGFGNETISDNKQYSLVDYQSILTLTRCLYEAFCEFELIYIYPDSEEKRLFIYNCYKLEGLKYYQKINNLNNITTNRLKDQDEVYYLEQNIFQSAFVLNSTQNQKTLRESLKHQSLVYFDESDSIKKFIKSTDYILFGIDKNCFEDVYKYLSINIHSSYLSIIQYKDAYNEDDQVLISDFVSKACDKSCSIMSFMIYDYCKLFPECQNAFKNMEPQHRQLILYYNDYYRNQLDSIITHM